MKKQIGFLGLGNMGLNMVYNLLDKGYEVHAWNRSKEPRLEAEKAGATVYSDISEVLTSLESPKLIWSMVSAGDPVDATLEKLLEGDNKLREGDIFIDGVNSHYKDTLRRGEMLEEIGVVMMDCGVSGGIEGARNGACIMVGGEKTIYDKYVEEIVKDMSTKDGYGYFGERGAGHYVKMVHNAIEYATMQAMGEGINLIHNSDYQVDFEKLTDVWNNGSIIAGSLMGFMNDAFKKDENLNGVPSQIGSLGTGKWSVAEALEKEVPFTNISNAVFTRYNSREKDEMIFKVVQALRTEFGGHTEKSRAYK